MSKIEHYEPATQMCPVSSPSDSRLRSASAGAHMLLGLQRTAGNAAVGALLQESHDERSPVLDVLASGGGHLLDAGLRKEMESRMGADFSSVRIHTDARASASAEAVGAQAYTVGDNIVFGSGGFDAGSEGGLKTLAHELTHVIQQRSGPVEGSAVGGGISVSRPDDRFEREAEATAKKVMASPRATSAAAAASAHEDDATEFASTELPRACVPSAVSLQRYQVEGPYDINDPVHETITQEALKQAGIIGPKATYTDKKAWEYARGSIWNDDPLGQLFDSNTKRTNDYSSGIEWYSRFSNFEKLAAKGQAFGPEASLLARSHFGDLQFLHGMAADMEKATVTRANMLMWAEVTYKIAIGQIPGLTRLGDIAVPGFRPLFSQQEDLTVNHLFQVEEVGDVKERAMGSLLHMVQDSYASGHAERTAEAGGHKGGVISFHSYAHQDHGKHGALDKLPSGIGSDVNKLTHVPGATDAVSRSVGLLKFRQDGRSWEDVKLYLELEVFNLESMTRPASAGDEFRAPHSVPSEPPLQPTESLPQINDGDWRDRGVRES